MPASQISHSTIYIIHFNIKIPTEANRKRKLQKVRKKSSQKIYESQYRFDLLLPVWYNLIRFWEWPWLYSSVHGSSGSTACWRAQALAEKVRRRAGTTRFHSVLRLIHCLYSNKLDWVWRTIFKFKKRYFCKHIVGLRAIPFLATFNLLFKL